MTTTEKVLLGISAVSICTSGFCCYMWLAYKQAVDILVAERDNVREMPFIGVVCGEVVEEEEDYEEYEEEDLCMK
jgi:hypothetical protein